MRDLQVAFNQLTSRNRDGSYSTQAGRRKLLSLIANQLWEGGFRHTTVQDLGGRHVKYLVDRWTAENKTVGTIKNRMTALRWWAEKIDCQALRAKNSAYAIGQRMLVNQISRATTLPPEKLAMISDEYVRMSLELQREFGLRREEAMKFQPSFADRGDKIVIKASWAKGGRAREIPILKPSQREALNRAHALAGVGSLIPIERSYAKQAKIYEDQTRKVDLKKMHGLRHAYAQRRYEELTGWKSPNNGGPNAQMLARVPEQKRIDRTARLQISQELGHNRESITASYLGR